MTIINLSDCPKVCVNHMDNVRGKKGGRKPWNRKRYLKRSFLGYPDTIVTWANCSRREQGYGYNVKYLYSEIARILGIDRQHNLIIIGAGNLGQAIANYTNFERRGFLIKGMFDVNPRLVGLVVRGVEIRGIEDLEQFIKDNEVQIAALTIPKSKAPEIADRLVKAGIKAIWNFAHTDLQVPDDVVVENVHLSESLMRLSYRVCSMQDQKAREEAQRKQEEAADAGETK